jgi:hypothetical protein
MKSIATALFIASALLTGAAQAAGSSVGDSDNTPFQGVYGQNESQSVSRAQVQADLAQAKATGAYTFGDVNNTVYQQVSEQATQQASKPVTVSVGGGDDTQTQLA